MNISGMLDKCVTQNVFAVHSGDCGLHFGICAVSDVHAEFRISAVGVAADGATQDSMTLYSISTCTINVPVTAGVNGA